MANLFEHRIVVMRDDESLPFNSADGPSGNAAKKVCKRYSLLVV